MLSDSPWIEERANRLREFLAWTGTPWAQLEGATWEQLCAIAERKRLAALEGLERLNEAARKREAGGA